MAHLTSFEKAAWFLPESFDSALYAFCNWSWIRKEAPDEKHIRKNLLEIAIGLGSYVIAIYFYPSWSLPVVGCLVSTLSPNAARWGVGTYICVTSLTNARGGGPAAAVIKNIACAALGYLATTPTPTIIMNKIVAILGEDKKE